MFYLKFLYVKLYLSCFELDICCFVIEIFLKMRNCLKCEFCDFGRVFLIGFFVMVVCNGMVSNGKVVLVNEGFK